MWQGPDHTLPQAFHLEVVVGLMTVLEPLTNRLTVYLHPLNFPDRLVDHGMMELVSGMGAQVRALPVVSMPPQDVLVLVSPEYRVDYVRGLIRQAQPKAVIALVHNGDTQVCVEGSQV